MGALKDLTGQKFGRLTVVERAGTTNHGAVKWLCKCDCGKNKIVIGDELRKGNTKSCGCYAIEQSKKRMKGKTPCNAIHKMASTPLYKVWVEMKRRCYNENDSSYKYYGGRGITVCDEWLHDFQAFYDWAMMNGYKEGLTIDRIDSNGNYKPSNCRWVTDKEQSNNKRNNHLITYNGKTQTIAQWADEKNITYSKLWKRINNGWNTERALNTP